MRALEAGVFSWALPRGSGGGEDESWSYTCGRLFKSSAVFSFYLVILNDVTSEICMICSYLLVF